MVMIGKMDPIHPCTTRELAYTVARLPLAVRQTNCGEVAGTSKHNTGGGGLPGNKAAMGTYPGGGLAVELGSGGGVRREGGHAVVGDDCHLHLQHWGKEKDMSHDGIGEQWSEGDAYRRNRDGGGENSNRRRFRGDSRALGLRLNDGRGVA
jgi:hypothetical protein